MNKRIRMMKKMFLCTVAALLAILCIAAAGAESGTVVTGGGRLNLRAEPESKARIVTKIKNGATVEVLDQDDEWAHVNYGKYEGYVQRKYLRMLSEAIGREIYSNGKTVWLRETPDENARIVGMVNTQQAMTVTRIDGEWIKVTADGTEGYVHTDEIDEMNEEPAGKADRKMEQGILKKKTTLYRDPDEKSEVLSVWPEGTAVSVSSYDKNWSLVKVADESVCGFARKVSVEMSPMVAVTDTFDEKQFISASKAKSAAVKALKKYSGFKEKKLTCSQHTALSVDGIRGPMYVFNFSNRQGQYVYAAYIHAYTGEVLYTGDFTDFIEKASQVDTSDLRTAAPQTTQASGWCYDENGEISWSGPTPEPRQGTDIGKSAARSVADRYLSSKYPKFSSLTFSKVTCRHAEDETEAAGFRVPYYQFDYFVDDGSGETAHEQLAFEIIIDAYNKEIQYCSASSVDSGNG